ncbi:MAG: site-2 protease family protein, partial [Chloroflexi bacterium]|nr:site-2 protease family protein [Chloroflexota bacterium]
LAHLDPLGTLMLLVARFGWGKPVPFNPYNLRNGPQAGMAMVSFAGPLANLFTASLFAILLRLDWIAVSSGGRFIPSPFEVVITVIFINVVLAVFNLLPIAPLDGFKVAVGLLPSRWAYPLSRLEYYGPLILILLILSGSLFQINILSLVLGPIIRVVLSLLLGS